MTIKGILFDYDGTLSDRDEAAYFMYRYVIHRLMPELDVKGYEYEAVVQRCMSWDEHGRISKKHVFEQVKKKYLPDLNVKEEVDRWYDEFAQFQVEQPGCSRLLEKLGKQYALGIVTNGDSKCQNAKIDQLGLRKYFKTVIVSGDFGKHKPEIDIYQKAAKNLGLKCEEVAFIGDTFDTDILGAYRAGMKPIWFNSNQNCITIYEIDQLHSYEELEEKFLGNTSWNK